MSFIDKVVAAVTPPESEASRREARAGARAAASANDRALAPSIRSRSSSPDIQTPRKQ